MRGLVEVEEEDGSENAGAGEEPLLLLLERRRPSIPVPLTCSLLRKVRVLGVLCAAIASVDSSRPYSFRLLLGAAIGLDAGELYITVDDVLADGTPLGVERAFLSSNCVELKLRPWSVDAAAAVSGGTSFLIAIVPDAATLTPAVLPWRRVFTFVAVGTSFCSLPDHSSYVVGSLRTCRSAQKRYWLLVSMRVPFYCGQDHELG